MSLTKNIVRSPIVLGSVLNSRRYIPALSFGNLISSRYWRKRLEFIKLYVCEKHFLLCIVSCSTISSISLSSQLRFFSSTFRTITFTLFTFLYTNVSVLSSSVDQSERSWERDREERVISDTICRRILTRG